MVSGASSTHPAPSADIAGRAVVLQYSDPVVEYNGFRQGAAVTDRSHRHRLVMEGAGAAAALNGLVTNDVVQLAPGQGLYAAALSTKGRIVADLRIFRRAGDSFLIDAPPRAAAGWMGIVRKYVNPRTAKYADVSDRIRDVGVFGPRAAQVVASVIGRDAELLRNMEGHAIHDAEWRGAPLSVVAAPELGLPGFELLVGAESHDALTEALVSAGGTLAGLSAWEIVRIESGVPEWGLDMDENTLAQEANLEELHAISYTKGCYTGQETVARVHFRGHVNRNLRMLRFVSVTVPPRGAQLFGEGDRNVGEVRSSAYSPRQGGVAIAMVRREAPVGSAVTVKWENSECQAGVHVLPPEAEE